MRMIYVSRSCLSDVDISAEINAIAARRLEQNAILQATGALIYTGTHFAEVIECNDIDSETLMTVIKAETYHHDIEIVERVQSARRQFLSWAAVYSGQAAYVQAILSACVSKPHEPHRRALLMQLFREFSKN